MGTIQLVERDDGQHSRVIQYRDNPDERPFMDFEREGFRAVLWGGTDLVTTAAALIEQGYRATNVLVTDSHDEELDDGIRNQVLEALNEGDAERVLHMLSHEYFRGFVHAITMSNRRAHARFRLMQYGRVEPLGSSDPTALVKALSAT
ncbi:hypothetical protein [Curtobacterium sp. VKM Ac-2922]|uniref:hypothetical protein n=1 Tax=Curtobacterium sp. VKM Ac-2922 TaxID=2929475 RepID=UPI001FB2ABBA|nr:hypothetical protein [Curtobacterium sp. VKM Ac-2922]MCJ1715104.1 hypothetical protein [Curtobacterium sp. VKM Ac-2922]